MTNRVLHTYRSLVFYLLGVIEGACDKELLMRATDRVAAALDEIKGEEVDA